MSNGLMNNEVMNRQLTSNGYVLDDTVDRLGRLEPVPHSERDDREALWDRLRRDGYLYLTGHLDPDLVTEFRSYYFDRLAHTGLIDRTASASGVAGVGEIDRAELRRVLFSSIVPGPEYAALCSHPRLRDWFAWFYAHEVHLHRRKIIRHTLPGERGIGTATQAHYDLVYLREGTDRVLSAWIPLGDIPISRGGLTYLEGSHRRTMAEEASGRLKRPAASMTADLPGLADEFDSRWLITDYQAGDIVVHSAYTVHAGLDNVDPGGVLRLSTDIRYQSLGDAIDWRWQQHWRHDDGL